MKNKIIIPLIIISILIFGVIAYKAPYLLPHEVLEPVRLLRDFTQELTRTTERNIGVPLKAQVSDNNFKVEEFVTGLNQPTQMAFIGNDLLVLEKNQGKVRLVREGILQPEPVLDVEVGTNNESGLLGIAVLDSTVYLYFTESEKDGGQTFANNVYAYTWDGNTLNNPILINTLSSESSWHNGGGMTVNKEGIVYVVIGDQMGGGRPDTKNEFTILQNHEKGEIDDSGVIVHVGLDNNVIQPKLAQDPLLHYYAMGIRNSFGLAIDPITGNMWDTENGPDNFDEINLVLPKFNSGWAIVMGPATEEQISKIPHLGDFQYNDPQFSWERTVTPTGLTFINSELFSKYKNEMLVGTCNFGQLFKFKLNEERNQLVFDTDHLQDRIANFTTLESGQKDFESLDEIIFGTGFGCITDVEMGPDGLLYVVSITDNTIYKILPK
ncbi:MAG: PQQ-dependent sugar dehydrogenase [Nitrosarchaeum sp.]|uniref:PQQ-dependent sugar dehydrogenase n=1 Tax=Nitrosarchaeum sp. TaxID=2026886 RepID=UPI002DE4B734|nr:PQQ-dependent sugar dehydrogenase [Nitrosarchaeum sp.]